MKPLPNRILLVEKDAEICEQIVGQTLAALGYQVEATSSAASAIQRTAQSPPDLIIADLALPDLSGIDLVIALQAQGVQIPIVLIAHRGMATDLIPAFRLGVSDYLLWPAREAEIVAAVERSLQKVSVQREGESLARQLRQANEELHRRVRELTTVFALGKAITCLSNRNDLFERIVAGGVYVAEADFGWLLLREDHSKDFLLQAQCNLPEQIAARLGQTWDDGVSPLVALSGETLSIYGEPLARFKVYPFGKSILIAPVKLKREVIGLLATACKAPRPFHTSNKTLLEALADYAAIAIGNLRQLDDLEKRLDSSRQAIETAQANLQLKERLLEEMQSELKAPLCGSISALEKLLVGESLRLNATQKSVLRLTLDKLYSALKVMESAPTTTQGA